MDSRTEMCREDLYDIYRSLRLILNDEDVYCSLRLLFDDKDIRAMYDLWKNDDVPEELRDRLQDALYDLHNWYHYNKGE